MEGVIIRKAVVVMAMVMILLAVVEGQKVTSDEFKGCYGKCYSHCPVTRPLWCSSLCIANASTPSPSQIISATVPTAALNLCVQMWALV